MPMLRISAAFFVLALSVAGPAAAGDVFTVSGVMVDATADDAAEARQITIAEGQRQALDSLLRRLTLPEDWPALPSLDAEIAESWVRGFQVANEKSSSTRYLAELTVSFQPGQVRNLLRVRDIAFSESQAKPALLLTVYETEDGAALWEAADPWRAAWAKRDLTNDLVPMVVPLGDIEDLTSLSLDQALSGDEEALLALAARYGAEQALVAHAKTDGGETALVAGEIGLDVVVTRTGPDGTERINRTFYGYDGIEPLAAEAARTMAELLAERWKRATIVRTGEGASISASVTFTGLSEWQVIRRRLGRVSLVRDTSVLALSAGGAQLSLDYAGTPDTLALSLAQQNLKLSRADGVWQLSLVR